MLKALQKKTVFESLCNKDYIGEVKKGNSLKIATINNPTISDYTVGSDITYEEVDGSDQTLNIDQQKYFAFKADDIKAVQNAIPLLEVTTEGAGFALADDFDQFLAGIIKTNGTIVNPETVPASPLGVLAAVVEALDNAKAPDDGRWIVVPPSYAKEIMLELAGKLTQNTDIITSGYIGSVFGLNVFKSVNIEKPLAGHVSAITLAHQISETESIRLQESFATGIRGLHVYGAKVTRPALCGEIEISSE